MIATITEEKRIARFQKVILRLSKVNEDLTICFTTNGLALFTVNSSFSLRPVVRFDKSFFTQYTYTHTSEEAAFQVTANNIVGTLNAINGIFSLEVRLNIGDNRISIKIQDKYKLNHSIDLYLQEAVETIPFAFGRTLLNVLAKINVNDGIFDEVYTAFKRLPNLKLSVFQSSTKTTYIKIEGDKSEEGILETTLTLRNSNQCSIELFEDNTDFKFSRSDLAAALKLASVVGNQTELIIGSSGEPLVIKASSSSIIEVECAIATMASDQINQNINSSEGTIEKVTDNPKIGKLNIERRHPLVVRELPKSTQDGTSQAFSETTQAEPWPEAFDESAPPIQRARIAGMVDASQSEGSDIDGID